MKAAQYSRVFLCFGAYKSWIFFFLTKRLSREIKIFQLHLAVFVQGVLRPNITTLRRWYKTPTEWKCYLILSLTVCKIQCRGYIFISEFSQLQLKKYSEWPRLLVKHIIMLLKRWTSLLISFERKHFLLNLSSISRTQT